MGRIATDAVLWLVSAALYFLTTREGIAYILLSLFVICCTVGAFLVYTPAGWITLGVTAGAYGLLLGSE